MASKIWFITGVSRGFGKELAAQLLARGDVVIGTTRDGLPPFTDDSGRFMVLPLDLTDPAAIAPTVARAQALHGHLDVVVNNAGYGLLGSVEEAGEDDVERLFNVNFHGTRRVVQAALPGMRRRRAGHIINITSIAGLAPGMGSGLYAASKFAVEGMSQSLAQEVAPLGIKVTLVEPGAFRTDFLTDHSLTSRASAVADYQGTVGVGLGRLEAMAGRQLGDPAKAAAAIIAVVEAPEPPLHLLLGSDAYARMQEKLKRFTADLERWRDTTLGTDFA